MMIRTHESADSTTIELAPIIDMVFLLLIFFLVATTFHQSEREMQIALPSAVSAGPISTALREIVINVDSAGDVIVSGQRMTYEDLSSLIEQAVASNPDQKVTIRGDRATPYERIVAVLDVCKGANIQEPYLDTVIDPGAPAP